MVIRFWNDYSGRLDEDDSGPGRTLVSSSVGNARAATPPSLSSGVFKCWIIDRSLVCLLVSEMLAFRIARRAFVKLFGIVGFLLALIGGALIGYSALISSGLSPISLFLRLLEALLGLGAIIAGVIIYTGTNEVRRIARRVRRIILLLITSFSTPAILVFAAGIVGIVGAAIKPPWWKFWKR